MHYTGDVSCLDCWEALQSDISSQLIDVRTMPEWNFVGLPSLEGIGKRAFTIEWQQFPTMQINTQFVDMVDHAVDATNGDRSSALYCMCRSGVRSMSAAMALINAGYKKVYNVTEGFEGEVNANGHRGKTGGWKYEKLPWRQM